MKRLLRMSQPEQLQSPHTQPVPPDFLIDVGSISWNIPKAATSAEIRSPRVVLTFGIGLAFLWCFVDLLERLHPKPNSTPDWVATKCVVGIVPLLLLLAVLILNSTNVVTLNHKGIRVELFGKPVKGAKRPRSMPYCSITDCRIESSRLVPALPCLTFEFPGRLRSKTTVRLEMPGSADVGAVVDFLSKKGVVCSDRR